MEHSKGKKTLPPILDRWAWSRARAQRQCIFAGCFHLSSIKPSRNLKENSENANMKFHDILWSFNGYFRHFLVAFLLYYFLLDWFKDLFKSFSLTKVTTQNNSIT